MTKAAYTEPGRAVAIDGEVVLDGPDGVGVAMTPAAARETARRLIKAADEAQGLAPTVAKT